jgi:hypothetical protein
LLTILALPYVAVSANHGCPEQGSSWSDSALRIQAVDFYLDRSFGDEGHAGNLKEETYDPVNMRCGEHALPCICGQSAFATISASSF